MVRVFRAFPCIVLVLLLSPTDSLAQATAQINGTVVDSSGGVLPGVTVSAYKPTRVSVEKP